MPKYNILLIDDDELFVFLTRQQLSKSNLLKSLHTATSEEKAIEILQETGNHPEDFPEIILIDLNLNGTSGEAVASYFQENFAMKFPQTRIFMLTSSLDKKRKEQAVSLPVIEGVLSKPLSVENLESRLMA